MPHLFPVQPPPLPPALINFPPDTHWMLIKIIAIRWSSSFEVGSISLEFKVSLFSGALLHFWIHHFRNLDLQTKTNESPRWGFMNFFTLNCSFRCFLLRKIATRSLQKHARQLSHCLLLFVAHLTSRFHRLPAKNRIHKVMILILQLIQPPK